MLNRWFKRVFLLCFVFLISCQTLETTNILHFKGSFSVEQNQRKQSHPVEIYMDSNQPILQINLLTPLGGVFASYLWKNQEHQIILPSRKQYFKQSKWPSDFPFQGLIQNPLWLYQALLKQLPENWNCKEINKEMKKCERNDFVIEWKKKFFQREKIHINLKKENFFLNLSQHKSPSNISLDIKIPKGFQQIKKLDLIQ